MIKLAALLLLAGPAAPADDGDVSARLKELQHQLSSRQEDERIDAIKKLGEIFDAKARTLLAKRVISDTHKVRIAAAQALVKHHHEYSVKAVANGIRAARGDRKLIRELMKALGDLDMCACVPVLVGVLQQDSTLAKEALQEITRIGCVDAAPGLIKSLGMAEKEAKKPDKFADIGTVNNRNRRGGRPNDRRDRDARTTDNPNKDKVLAALVKPVGEALRKLTGKGYKGHDDWLKAAASGALSRKQAKVYFCEHARKRFTVAPGDRVACPFEGAPKRHDDIFQKHQASD